MFLLQCTMVLSPLNDGICPSAAISQGNNCFWVKYFDISFTFDLYLGTNWIVATTARESMELLTGMWKDVFWIFGTSWMLCELAVLVNENIWKIFAPWRGRLCKKFFWRLSKGRVWVAFVQNFNLHSPPFMFFVHKYHIFDKYLTKIFPPGSLGSLDRTLVSKSCSIFSFKISTKLHIQNVDKKEQYQTSPLKRNKKGTFRF